MRLLEHARKCSPAIWQLRSVSKISGVSKRLAFWVDSTRNAASQGGRRPPYQNSQVPPDRGRSVRTSQWHPMMRDDPVAVRSTGHPAQCIDRGKPSEATPCSRGRSHERRAERRLPACGARAISGVLCVQRDRQQTRSQWRRLATAPGQPARRPAIALKQPRRRRQDARSHAQIHTAPGGGGACTRHRPRCTPRAAGSA